ncbi:MAG: sigma-E factor negative regulatory protein [Burkholderiales bacterium]
MDTISALVDGELDEDQVARELSRIKQHDSLRECWDTFHLIGDAMRGDCHVSSHLSARIAERLANEPTVVAPRRGTRRIAAYALSAAASLSAVALVAWVAFSSNPLAPQEMAQTRPHVVPQLASVPSQGSMNEYLRAHQAFSPSTAIQGVVPYIRSVSDNQPLPNR